MDSAKWQKIKDTLSALLDLPENQRPQFLEEIEDEEIRLEVEKMWSAQPQIERFIETPILIQQGLIESENRDDLAGKIIENYRILDRIGTGGMGAVYLAERLNSDFKQKVAFKIIKRGMDSELIQTRFAIERKILSTLKHPNIAQLLDGGISLEGLSFFVMEYVDGKPLNKFCDENNLSLFERLEIFQKICAAVDHAHKNLIIHRDLKPSNVLVTNDGIPKLLDFGIAKLLSNDSDEATLTATIGRVFTPEYASPEQILGRPATTATDVYSLGVILYELLSGHRPFETKGKSFDEIVQSVCETPPTKPSQAITKYKEVKTQGESANPKPKTQNPKTLQGDLDNIILKALEKEPLERYGSVQQFSEDLERFLQGLPVLARPQTLYYLFGKYVKRHKIGVLAAAFVLTSLIGGISIASWQAVVARRERAKAEKRLYEIREVAKSLMNETNDSLAKIPGNVIVQKALTEKSVALLDSLANEETKDSILLAELAEAYTKLAIIQLWSFREFDKALINLEKSETIYQKILKTAPNNPDIHRKIYTTQLHRIEALHDSNQREEMFGVGAKAILNLIELTEIDDKSPSNFANLAAMYGWFGDKSWLFGQIEKAVENYRKGVAIIDQAIEKQIPSSNTIEGKAELARLIFIKGWLVEGEGNSEKAIEIYLQSGKIAQEVFRESPMVVRNFSRVTGSFERIAKLNEKQDQLQQALDNFLKARNLVKAGLKEKDIPEYSELMYVNCNYTTSVGRVSAKLGLKNDAQNSFIEAESICWQNIIQDESDKENIFESLPNFYEIADFFKSIGETERAVGRLTAITIKMQNILDENANDLKTALSLAETFEKIGDVSNKNKQREFYEKSVKLWRDYQHQNAFLPAENEKMNRVSAKLLNLK